MFPVGQIDGFSYYQMSEEDIQRSLQSIENFNEINQQYLQNKLIEPPIERITGSFIYAHPPDYRGFPMLHAEVDEWREVLRKLKAQGIDTVIFQAAIWAELKECYYKSNAFSHYKTWNVIEPMLQAARQENIRVFLGGYGSVVGWTPSLTVANIKKEIKLHLECYKELLKWQDMFEGFYFPCETAFKGKRDTAREQVMNCLYSELINNLKILATDKLVLISPASIYFSDMEQVFCEAWFNMLRDVKVDILAPQDSIGCCGISLPDQIHMYQLWKKVAEHTNAELWANIELFEAVKFNDPERFITASNERIFTQINNAVPYVKKLICWEALYFSFTAEKHGYF